MSADLNQAEGRPSAARFVEPRERIAVSVSELGRMVGVDEKTLRQWTRERGMPSYRVGRRVLVVVSEFLEWLRQYGEQPERDLQGELGTLLERLGREPE